MTEMKLFLVQDTVCYTPYMNDPEERAEIRLVWAESESDTRDKYREYYERKCESHGDSYHAYINSCNEAIGTM